MTGEQRHPDHERVKARLLKALADRGNEGVVEEAIRLGARAPDPREELSNNLVPILMDWQHDKPCYAMARAIVNYTLDNAPKEG